VEISIVGTNSIKIKGKQAAFIIDPSKQMPKMTADAIILLDKKNEDIDTSRILDFRIVIDGPGEYGVGGYKISATKTPSGVIYKFLIDDINIVLGFATETKMENFGTSQAVIVNTNADLNESFVTALEPKLAILYGVKKTESAKSLGAESVSPVAKIALTKDKLPEKMEVVILG